MNTVLRTALWYFENKNLSTFRRVRKSVAKASIHYRQVSHATPSLLTQSEAQKHLLRLLTSQERKTRRKRLRIDRWKKEHIFLPTHTNPDQLALLPREDDPAQPHEIHEILS